MEQSIATILEMKPGVTFNTMPITMCVELLMDLIVSISIKDGIWHMMELLLIKIQMESRIWLTLTAFLMTVNSVKARNVISHQV